ncbi:NAD(P)H-binding protein [Lacticaseibacillus parakribbianus]|uniref:NAD(P)H-binding protein n=1 Tax=Lacticaseibacillus parakribbianus TaxID=2970927 RepID=UPI0021CAFA1C|nr:NAD(P)H-binding protein [Lacticaseibacillus parakribbianus]
MNYLVTGATGHLGSRVVERLSERVGAGAVTAAVHTPAKATALVARGVRVVACDYLSVAGMTAAFTDQDVVIVIPSKTYDLVQRIQEFENTIQALTAAKVAGVVFVSFFADQERNPFVMSPYYAYAPRRLATSGLTYAVVKNALYADPLVPYLPELIQRQALIYPVGSQKLSFITLADSATAIAALATQPALRDRGQSYLLSQSTALSMPALGRIMSDVTGRPIGYHPVSNREFGRIYAAEGDGAELASMYAAGALGLLGGVSADYRRLTGYEPEGMAAFLTREYRPRPAGGDRA